MDEQLKLAHKLIDLEDQANTKICLTLLRYNVEKPESSYAQVRVFAKKKEEQKFPQISMWFINLQKIYMYLMYRILYMIKLLLTNQSVISWKKSSHLFALYHCSFYSSQDELGHWR